MNLIENDFKKLKPSKTGQYYAKLIIQNKHIYRCILSSFVTEDGDRSDGFDMFIDHKLEDIREYGLPYEIYWYHEVGEG